MNNNLDIETITLDQLSTVTGGWAGWNQSSPSQESWSGSAGAGSTSAAWSGWNNNSSQQWSWAK